MKLAIKALACAAVAIATPAAAANIITNPVFETGALAPWAEGNIFSGGVPWFVTDADAHTGTFSAEDTGNRELWQNFGGVLGSTIDQVSFWARHPNERTNDALAYIFYYSDLTDPEFLVFLTGTDWNFFNVTAQLDPSKTLVGFSVYGNSSGDPPVTRLDDVIINAVPEPATWAMMLLGFGAIGLTMRRRRTATALA